MAKHKHAKSKTPKPAPATSPPAGAKSVNWHRIIWELSQPTSTDDPHGYFKTHFFASGSANQFWLEPEVYPGPPVSFGQGPALVQFDKNSLCFRVRFVGNDMAPAWQDCVLFPRGSQPLQFNATTKKPEPATDTERLVGRTKVKGKFAKVNVYMVPNSKPRQLRIYAGDIGLGSHLGMGIAHQ
ncbi:MAG: hypothetical protein EHM84_05265 [Lysobacterales bacterium]|nr:MAG: hypothetical protein EHM84_05265 [Xanthomonadales bacterium]